jgi:hypothetical protein
VPFSSHSSNPDRDPACSLAGTVVRTAPSAAMIGTGSDVGSELAVLIARASAVASHWVSKSPDQAAPSVSGHLSRYLKGRPIWVAAGVGNAADETGSRSRSVEAWWTGAWRRGAGRFLPQTIRQVSREDGASDERSHRKTTGQTRDW